MRVLLDTNIGFDEVTGEEPTSAALATSAGELGALIKLLSRRSTDNEDTEGQLDIIYYYRQISCDTICFVHQLFYHVARLVYISVSRVGRTVATESSDAAASRRLRHHDSGVVPPAGAILPGGPESRLPPTFGKVPGRRPLSMAPAVATHFRHCDVLTLNSLRRKSFRMDPPRSRLLFGEFDFSCVRSGDSLRRVGRE
jgi:hypothetical protein